MGGWGVEHSVWTCLCLSVRGSLLRGESWVERKEEGREGGRFWAKEEPLRSCEELGKV